MPDADSLTGAEIGAALELKPAAMLCLVYAQWDTDRKDGKPGVSEQIADLARSFGHDRLYVRFHADPHPPGYAKKIGGPEAWGRLCAQRMTQYYQSLADAGIQLHAILANETDASYEGGLSVAQASDFHRRSMGEYAAKRPQDMLHVPAPTGAPSTHREHLERYKADGWVTRDMVIDGHGYDGDLESVIDALYDVFPKNRMVITETNNLDDFHWPIDLLAANLVEDIVYFTLNWARGGEGRVQPPTPDDAAKQMSLMRFPARYAQFKATVVAQPEPAPDPDPVPEPVMTEYETFIRDAAQKRGIDPDIAVRVANSEGSVTEPARRGTFDTGSSWWAFQLHYGGAGYEFLGNVAGMGNGFTELTGWQPGDPAAWKDATRYALNRAKLNGWGAWYGAAHVGIGQWDGIDRNFAWNANSETWDYEAGVTPVPDRVTYNAGTPAIAQNDPWSCSTTALRWALTALGRHPAESWIEDTMKAEGVVTEADGLLDATGKGLADFVTRQYGEFGFYANNEPSVTFDGVALEGDHAYPLLIGGRAWGHWSGCSGYDAGRDVLLLANPAENWMGVGQTMNRGQFASLGPFSMVRMLHPDLLVALPPEPTPVPVPQPSRGKVLLSEIRTRLDELESLTA